MTAETETKIREYLGELNMRKQSYPDTQIIREMQLLLMDAIEPAAPAPLKSVPYVAPKADDNSSR